MKNDPEFKNLEELFNRVLPALNSKVYELRRLGYKYPDEKDVWNFLVTNKWKNKTDLCLSELVSNIIHIDNYELNEYVLEKMSKLKREESTKDISLL